MIAEDLEIFFYRFEAIQRSMIKRLGTPCDMLSLSLRMRKIA